MRISKERFEELISLYLDKEASAEELALLSDCVRENRQMRAIWLRACRVHTAIMKLYGKDADFIELPKVGQPFKKRGTSKMRACLEWTAAAALMFLSFALLVYAVKFFQNDADSSPDVSNYEYGREQNLAFYSSYEVHFVASPNMVKGEYSVVEINPRTKSEYPRDE